MADQSKPAAPAGDEKPAGVKGGSLTLRERKFIEYYLADPEHVASHAWVKAGYAPSGVDRAYNLLKKPLIVAEIERKMRLLEVKTEVTTARTLQELARIAFANMQDYVSVTDGGDAFVDLTRSNRDQWAAIKKIKVKEYKQGRGPDARDVIETEIELESKNAALGTIAKHLGMLNDKLEVVHKYEGMNLSTLEKHRVDLSSRKAEILGSLRQLNVPLPKAVEREVNAPATDTVQ